MHNEDEMLLTITTSILESGLHSTDSLMPMAWMDSLGRRCRTIGTHGCKKIMTTLASGEIVMG